MIANQLIFLSVLKVINSLTAYKNIAKKSTVVLYQLVVKAFKWPAIHFYSDLAYLIGVLSCFYSNSRLLYIELVKHIL